MIKEILILLGVILVGAAGIFGHWLARWQQGRTGNDFMEYMKEYKWYTLQSVMANLTASFTVYANLPANPEPKQLMLILIGLYMAGFALDSKLNKENPNLENIPATPAKPTKPRRKTADENADKDLSDLLDSDSNK